MQSSGDIPRMADLIARHDWASTSLGAIESWPQSRKTAVDIMLASGHAMQLAWGPDRIVLYNDAYAPMLGDRHPAALGRPFRDAWPEIWDEIEPLVERVFAGETVKFENLPLVMTRSGYREDTWWNFSYSPVRDETGAVAGLLNVTLDVTAQMHAARVERERDEANARVREKEERLRALVNASSDVVYMMSADWTEMRQLDGRGFIADTSAPSIKWIDDYLFPEDRADIVAVIDQAVASKAPFELEHRLRRADGSVGWTFSRAVPILDADGEISEWFGMAADVTGRRESEERQHVLVGELQHRTRNLMAVVRAVADRTSEASRDLADFRLRFRDRLEALARVQGLLSRLGETDRIAFDELLATELAAMGSSAGRVTLDGPSGVRLRSSMVQTLAMALHELATNAVKYGALGQAQAQLAVKWWMTAPDTRGRPWLHIDWRETGVDMPSAPAASQGAGGQGRELIEAALPHQLGAKTSFVLEPDGIRCTITIPVSASNVEAERRHG